MLCIDQVKYGVQLDTLRANVSASESAVDPAKRDEYRNKVKQQCEIAGDVMDSSDLEHALANMAVAPSCTVNTPIVTTRCRTYGAITILAMNTMTGIASINTEPK